MVKGMSWMKTNVQLAKNDSDKTIADLITDGCKWESWLNNYIDRFIDMKGREKEHRQINHFNGAGNTASFPSKSCKPVSLRKVVAFNQMCF